MLPSDGSASCVHSRPNLTDSEDLISQKWGFKRIERTEDPLFIWKDDILAVSRPNNGSGVRYNDKWTSLQEITYLMSVSLGVRQGSGHRHSDFVAPEYHFIAPRYHNIVPDTISLHLDTITLPQIPNRCAQIPFHCTAPRYDTKAAADSTSSFACILCIEINIHLYIPTSLHHYIPTSL